VLPILHLNGYKISGPTVLARTGDGELRALFNGRGYEPYFVEGDDPAIVHQSMANALDLCYADIRCSIDALKYVPRLRSQASDHIDFFQAKLHEHSVYIRQNFEDMPEVRNWHWTADFTQPDAPPALAKGQPRGAAFTDA
jgi:phosphoketolase